MDRGALPLEVFVDEAAGGAGIGHLVERARAADVPVRTVSAGVLDRVAEARHAQGIVAVFARPLATAADLEPPVAAALVVALAGIGDPGNLGTIVRSADASGASGIVIGPGSVDAYNPKAIRGSAGAVFGLPVVEGEVDTVLATLSDRYAARTGCGVRRLGAVAEGGIPIDQVDLTVPVAFVLGHETRGLDGTACDDLVTIPMRSHVESINVAMAATICTYEAARQRRGAGLEGRR